MLAGYGSRVSVDDGRWNTWEQQEPKQGLRWEVCRMQSWFCLHICLFFERFCYWESCWPGRRFQKGMCFVFLFVREGPAHLSARSSSNPRVSEVHACVLPHPATHIFSFSFLVIKDNELCIRPGKHKKIICSGTFSWGLLSKVVYLIRSHFSRACYGSVIALCGEPAAEVYVVTGR